MKIVLKTFTVLKLTLRTNEYNAYYNNIYLPNIDNYCLITSRRANIVLNRNKITIHIVLSFVDYYFHNNYMNPLVH